MYLLVKFKFRRETDNFLEFITKKMEYFRGSILICICEHVNATDSD